MASPRGCLAAACLVTMLLAGCAPWRDDARTWAPERPAIVRELDHHARPIAAADGAIDVEPVWRMTRDARVIGIGEPGHGLLAPQRFMQAIVARAAADTRPLVIGLDIAFIDGLELDGWARGASDDAATELPAAYAVAGQYRALLADIRAHNLTVAPERAVQVTGLDACTEPLCVAPLAAYFADVDPEFTSSAVELLGPFVAIGPGASASLVDARDELEQLRERLHARRDAYVASRGPAAHSLALRLVRLAELRIDLSLEADVQRRAALRAEIMADTVTWLADQRPDARIIVLGNNEYTRRSQPASQAAGAPMGRLLAGRFGADYVAVHTTFDCTTMLAQRMPMWSPPGTLEATLRRPGHGYALDVRSAAAGVGSLARYLQEAHWTRSYLHPSFARRPTGWSNVTPTRDYDVLVYLAFVATVNTSYARR